MGFKVATRRVYGIGSYQVRSPTTGAVVAPFAPSDLSGLLGWYKFDALALSDGAAIAACVDSSSAANNLSQGTAGSKPTFNTAQQNGLAAATFDGAGDCMFASAYASPTAGATVIAALKVTAGNAYRTLLNHAAAATWASPYSRVLARVTDDTSTDVWQFIVEDATSVPNTVQDIVAATTTWQIMEFVYDQTNLRIYRAGTQLATKARSGTLTSSTQVLLVGADTGGATTWKGQIGELLYYNRGLNSTELGQVRTYLQTKWGL